MQFNSAFWGSLMSIIVIDIILSGDNAVVIAMAVQSLPADKRQKGIFIGTAAAVILRILLTLVASQLLTTPLIKLAGGAAILWIAVKLLAESEAQAAHHHAPESIGHAVRLIIIADASMSVDNVMAVAGASHGNLPLLWFGLMLSIPLVVFASSMLSKLMARYTWIVLIGALLLGKIGGEMMATDHFLMAHLIPEAWHTFTKHLGEVLGVALVAGAAYYYHRREKNQDKKPQPETI
jgi:YjbE family integral membrane protein